MTKNMFFAGLLVIAAAFGMLVAGCDNDPGDGGPVTPTVINGYYGVISDGKTIEVIATSGNYVLRLDGVEFNRGPLNASPITLNPTTGTTVVITTSGGAITGVTVTSNGQNMPIQSARDYYYSTAMAAPTSFTRQDFESMIAGKTPKQVYEYCQNHPDISTSNYEVYEGTWADMVALAREEGVPVLVFSQVAEIMNAGKISGFGFFYWPEYKINVIYYISKIPIRFGD
jgi:hypothetical protein